ncbi:hypothetical protein GGR57DRAFT_508970 [Xylariaceae sp. FL1272]|nr:hypothetical protein GGR57DRAFT_508970 [Xylariaceae sp. FL1272]
MNLPTLLKTILLIGGVSARFWRDPRQITITITSWPPTTSTTTASSTSALANISTASGLVSGTILTKTLTQFPLAPSPPPPSPLSPPPVPWETDSPPVPWETNSGPATAPSASTPVPFPLPATATTHPTLATPLPPLQPSGSPVPSAPSPSILPAPGSPGSKCGKGYTYCGYMLASSNHNFAQTDIDKAYCRDLPELCNGGKHLTDSSHAVYLCMNDTPASISLMCACGGNCMNNASTNYIAHCDVPCVNG